MLYLNKDSFARRSGRYPDKAMKFNIDKKYISIGITSFLVVAASICFYYLIFHGDRFVTKLHSLVIIASPVLYGIVLAYLLTPLVNSLEHRLLEPIFIKKGGLTPKKKKGIRVLSVIMTLIIVIIVVYTFFSILIPNIITSIKSISFQLPYYIRNLTEWSEKYLEDNPDIEAMVLQVLDIYSEEFNNFLNNNIIPQLESLLRTVSLSLIGVIKVLWNFLIGIIISIYVLFSKETFAGQTKKMIYAMFSDKMGNRIIRNSRFVSDTFIGFISGKIIDSIIIGFICFLGTQAMDTPYALLVSVVVGVTNIIPFFGPYLGAIPSALLILMVNPAKCIYFIIFILILQQVDGNIIGPKILGGSTGLSGFWVIFAITIFGGMMGIPGMIIGVPVFAVLYAMVRSIVNRQLEKKGLPITSSIYQDADRVENNKLIPRQEDHRNRKFFKLSLKSDHKKKTTDGK